MPQTEVLRLGVDPRPGVRGMSQFDKATASAIGRAWSMNAVLGTLAVSFGALATARGIGAGVRGMIEFDSAMNQSLAIMGDVSGAMRGEMAAAARQVGVDLNFAATEGAEAFFFLASAGLDAEQSLAALPAVAQFARAGMFDFATATDLATDAQSAMGLTVDDSAQNLRNLTRVTDVLVKANTLANATVEQFATSLTTEAATAARSFGVSLEDTVAVLAAYADQGIKGGVAGSSFARMLRLMIPAVNENREEFERLEVAVVDANDQMLPMADIIEDLTHALAGMGVTQKSAQLEALGFQKRMQGVILPLLETEESVRGFNASLVEAGGSARDVSDNQMLSLENRIGQLRQQFNNWRAETMGGTVPALEFMIDNAQALTDVVVALTIAAGAAGAVGAFVALAPAVMGAASSAVFLVTQLTSLSNALVVLQLAIGPAGWVALGIGAIAAAVLLWRDRQRALNAELAGFNDAIEALELSGAGKGAEELRRELELLDGSLARARQRVQELEAQKVDLPVSKEGLAELERINGLIDGQEDLIALLEARVQGAATAYVALGEAADGAMPDFDPAPLGEINDLLSETTELVAAALDLDINRAEILEEAASRRDAINALLEAGVGSLEEEIALTQALGALNSAMSDNIQRRIDLREREIALVGTMLQRQRGFTDRQLQFHQDLGRASGELVVQTLEWAGAAEKVGSNIEWTRDQAADLIAAATEGASSFEGKWVAAINVVGSSLGGLASQIGNIVSAFATGGAVTGFAALLGAGLGMGGEDPRAAFERAHREWERALDDFAAMFGEQDRFEQMRQKAEAAALDLIEQALLSAIAASGSKAAQMAGASLMEPFLASIQDMDFASAMQAAEDFARKLGLSGDQLAAVTDQLEENFRRIEEQRQREIASMEDDLAVRMLIAQGRDGEAEAMRRQLQQQEEVAEALALGGDALAEYVASVHEAEEAARLAVEAERELVEARRAEVSELNLLARELALSGDDLAAMEASLEAAMLAELARAEAAVRAGDMSEEAFARLAAVLNGEMAAALDAYNERLQEQAERAREQEERIAAQIASLEDEIAVRELLAAGLDAEAELLRLEIRQRQELAEAMALVGDEADDLIQRLLDLQEAEREALEARDATREAEEIAARTGAATARISETIASAASLTEATGNRMSDLLWSQLAIQRQIEANTRGARSAGAQSWTPAPSGSIQASTAPQTVRLLVSVQDDRIRVTSSDPSIAIDVVDQGLGARQAARTRLDGDMRTTR